ncbi:hypothetical protein DeepPurple_gp026 [Bacillus phage Deep-Purple]|uniref:Uncharacterized protein n=2 Tax=root TaxID=1 RepID=A0A1Z1LZQ1_9CAUD|nr:Gp15 family bacterioprotein [Bacillus phage Deep-Purple]ARW58277.1 hypothetical protein DeepPurple_gp026 [Bacillus phage Deep-Purple]
MFKLTDTNLDSIHFAGVNVALNLYYDNVLAMYEMFDDKSIAKRQKPYIALQMLMKDRSLLSQLDGDQQAQLLIAIFKERFDRDLTAETSANSLTKAETNKDNSNSGINEDEKDKEAPVVDFTIDAPVIFSSFLSAYGINLYEQQGKLLWCHFIAMFHNLPDDSAMKKIIGYRTNDIPKRTEYNAEEVKHLRKMRDLYELPEAKAIREERELKAYQVRSKALRRVIEAQQEAREALNALD